jgi:signal transduction histidine kinase
MSSLTGPVAETTPQTVAPAAGTAPAEGTAPAAATTPTGRRIGSFDLVFGIVVGLVTVLSVALLLAPGPATVIVAPGLDVAVNMAATIVAVCLAGIAWARYREGDQAPALFRASAFLALAVTNSIILVLVLLGIDREFGLSIEAPGQAPAYTWTLARGATAVLLLLSALAARQRWQDVRWPLAVLFLPSLLVVVTFALLPAWEGLLPPVTGPGALIDLIDLIEHRRLPDVLPALSGLLAALQMFVAFVFAAGALVYVRLYRRDGRVGDAFLAAGLVVAAFSQEHFALYPVVYTSVVTAGDGLRVLFSAILLVGLAAEVRADLAALRGANLELERLRDVEVARAALEERARLAREVHDGLAQDLWFAKLKQGRQLQVADLPAEAEQLGQEVSDAIDSALAEARQAVMAMRAGAHGESSLAEVLERYVDDFGDRFGLQAEFAAPTTAVPRLPARTEAELLRIVQEALNNVRKHADATVVWVTAQADEDRLHIDVVDNGRGFDRAAVGSGSFGLQSMRERAELIGAAFTVTSAPQDGTRVEVVVPFDRGVRA